MHAQEYKTWLKLYDMKKNKQSHNFSTIHFKKPGLRTGALASILQNSWSSNHHIGRTFKYRLTFFKDLVGYII
jgi:hypothetical protein